jgi:hypothetical protein
MKALLSVFALTIFFAGCATQGDKSANPITRTYVTTTAFHQFPEDLTGHSFMVVPGEKVDPNDLEASSYSDCLKKLIVSRGMVESTSTNLASVDYVFFLRFKDLPPRSFNNGPYGLMTLKRCSVRIDVDSPSRFLSGKDAPSLCQATVAVDTYGTYSRALAVPCALRQFARAFPFAGQNPYTHEQKFGELTADYP